MKKRLLSGLLVLMMLLTLLPVGVLAETAACEHVDTDPENGFCDTCSSCLHTMDFDGFCTDTDCAHGACENCGGKKAVGEAPAAPSFAELTALGLYVTVICDHPSHAVSRSYWLEDGTWDAHVADYGDGYYECSITVDTDYYISLFDRDNLGIHTGGTKDIPGISLYWNETAWALYTDEAEEAEIRANELVIHAECIPDEPALEPEYYTIYAEAGRHGSVTNEDRLTYVEKGGSKTFYFYPDKGYEVSAVYVDGYLVNYYGVGCEHHWTCDGCDDCWWIDWSEWYHCGNHWCDHRDCWHSACTWTDWQNGVTFYNVNAHHQLYVEFAPVDSGCPSAYYLDLNTEAWYHEATDFVIEKDLMKGVGGKYFAPNGVTTRGQLVTMLYRLAGEPRVNGKNVFSDVAEGMWYTDAVIWAAGKEIVSGYGDGTFGVDDAVTREQTVTILYRFAKCKGIRVSDLASLAYFVDAEQVSEFAEKPFGWAVEEDIIEGKPASGWNLKLDPQGSTSRVEMAAMLMRYVGYVD